MRIPETPTRPDVVGFAEAPLVRDAIKLITDAEREFAQESHHGDGIVSLTHCGGYTDLLLDNLSEISQAKVRALLPRLGRNLIPVTVTIDLALDADAWDSNYDTTGAGVEVRADMAGLLREAVEEFILDWIDRTGNVGNAAVKATGSAL